MVQCKGFRDICGAKNMASEKKRKIWNGIRLYFHFCISVTVLKQIVIDIPHKLIWYFSKISRKPIWDWAPFFNIARFFETFQRKIYRNTLLLMFPCEFFRRFLEKLFSKHIWGSVSDNNYSFLETAVRRSFIEKLFWKIS